VSLRITGIGRISAALFLVTTVGNSAPAPKDVQKFEPNWESISKHKVPKWYDDAKFGIFVHWGLYSVPAWAPPVGKLHEVDWDTWFKTNAYAEWYLNSMKIDGSPTQKHHIETYGKDFGYLDFIPRFNEEIQKWNPDEMAGFFQQVGARYVVLTTKHHDGFLLWPSSVRNPNRAENQQHAARDIPGDLAKAVRAHGMRMGLYYSGGLDWSFNPRPIVSRDDVTGTVIHTEEYARHADAHWRELIARYKPTILWNDIGYPKQGDLEHIFAGFYNAFPEGLVNNRFGTGLPEGPKRHYDFTTPEYQKMDDITQEKWEATRGLGYSFGYNQVEDAKQTIAPDELIHLLIDVVSKNGNLLLNVGPMANGKIPEIQADRLRALGQWLAINGEAIYETRPWRRAEGKTTDGVGIRFTSKGDTIYCILLAKPKGPAVTIESLTAAEGSTIHLLGTATSLKWTVDRNNLKITLPVNLPDAYAYAFRISSGRL
jgi:alpha-L-fucosidase